MFKNTKTARSRRKLASKKNKKSAMAYYKAFDSVRGTRGEAQAFKDKKVTRLGKINEKDYKNLWKVRKKNSYLKSIKKDLIG